MVCFTYNNSWFGLLKTRVLNCFLKQTRPVQSLYSKSAFALRMSQHERIVKESCDSVKKETKRMEHMKVPWKEDNMSLYLVIVVILFILGIAGVSLNKYFQEGNLQPLIDWIESFGPLASAVYGALYFLLEVVCLPAFPLTVAAGYLFGFWKGLVTVSLAGTCASGVSFLLSRYTLRSIVQNVSKRYERFQTIDSAISRQGFRIVFLLRLSPILPFAISNYLYGLTSIPIGPYILASWLGRSVTLSMNSGIELHSEWFQQPLMIGAGILVSLGVVSQISKLATEVLNEEEKKKVVEKETTQREDK
ncbi:TVP38/TMEM64 family membrane protein [Galdieria sulphuraria]|nr:TVP38/TMEM64 family membrane protein [Galdieria sulphuraria]